MVRGADNGNITAPLCIIIGNLDGGIEGQCVADDADGVICMRGPVHLAALDHQEEAIRVLGQDINGFFCHFRQ